MRRKIKSISKHRGIALFAALIFVAVFMAMAAGMVSMSSANAQVANSHRQSNAAMNAAMSGLEYARYQIGKTNTGSPTASNTVSDTEADQIWANLLARLIAANVGGQAPINKRFGDNIGDGDEILTGQTDAGVGTATFQVRFYRYDGFPRTLYVMASGTDRNITRKVQVSMNITKSADVLQYAIAGRGRMWLAGDTTIHGSIYSSYGKKSDGTLLSMSPFNITSDSKVEGTVNTILTQDEIATRSYQLETLDADGNPLFEYGTSVFDGAGNPVADTYGPCDSNGYLTDAAGDPVYDETGMRIPVDFANRLITGSDELLGYHEGVNYGQPDRSNIPGLSIADYNTSVYKNAISSTVRSASNAIISDGVLSTSGVSTVTEYFPHKPLAQGGYGTAASSSSLKLTRRVYKDKTIRNVRVNGGTNALFRDCIFEDVLYIDCDPNGPTSTAATYNNIRFENCTFNGVIVTNTPQSLNTGWWMRNNLYFTGSANFNNQSSIKEATILAPHFNVNLGDANNGEVESEENVITGAVVGGIVDVRGNAQINGTIISMADTSSYSSGYVTNIGATLGDGGSETTTIEDIGTIDITPNPDQMLPSGIKTPIVIKPIASSYTELRCPDES